MEFQGDSCTGELVAYKNGKIKESSNYIIIAIIHIMNLT